MFHKRNYRNAIFGGAFVAMLPLGLASPPAMASTPVTSQFTVQATVNASCTISATNLNFGNYTGAQLDGQTTIAVNCSSGTPYDVALDGGSQNDPLNRLMNNGGSDHLSYQLFSDSGRSTPWGSMMNTDTVHGTGAGSEQDLTVYGRVAAGSAAAPGTYTDTITATLTY